jgi:hypothetical protein
MHLSKKPSAEASKFSEESSMNILSEEERLALGYNPNRTIDLFAFTPDGYIIAQDIACQYEYVLALGAEEDRVITPIAHINRAFQGLSEIVAIDRNSGEYHSFIFDISNAVYQSWLTDYMNHQPDAAYDGPVRAADPAQRYFTENEVPV